MGKDREFAEIIFEKVRRGEIKSKRELESAKNSLGKELGMTKTPTNPDIMEFASESEIGDFARIINLKPTRTISGVSVITVVAKPAPCPGECIYCPKGANAPQSYTGMEPAVQRAIRNGYDPFLQAKDRLNQYKIMGHASDKIELIILGGTFLSMEKDYQEWFVKRVFDVLNGKESESLGDAEIMNEGSRHRCVGLTIETRPDFCFEKHINQMLGMGGTRVEIGTQSIYPDVLKKIRRGHTVEDTIRATKLAKDSGLKCTYHMMPGLFVNPKEDLKQFKVLFESEDFRPDSLKVYPTLVMPGTELHNLWKGGNYEPLETEKAVELLSEAMRYIPKYCRVIRVQRDIPVNKAVAGVMKSNLRELVEKESERKGIAIKEIRYREVGHKLKAGIEPEPDSIELLRMDYDASGGKEVFLSFEDMRNDIILGFLRLRIPDKPFRPEIGGKTALVRELHVFGPSVPIGKTESGGWQHRGFGRKLIGEAERISNDDFGMKKVTVISGIGVREYYRGLGYKNDGVYVSKIL
jgi:elongator complex protein 3